MGENFIIDSDGKARYKSTLAHSLDTRNLSIGEPNRRDLPEAVNPLEMLLRVLGGHLTIVKVRDDCIQNDLTECFSLLNDLMPVGDRVKVVKYLEGQYDVLLPSLITESMKTAEVVKFSDSFDGDLIQEANNG